MNSLKSLKNEMLNRSDLHDYQNRTVQFIKDKQRAFLMLDMGLGKTVTTLTAISDLIAEAKVKRVLIIAPLRVANSVWHTEAKRWDHLQNLDFTICTGDPKSRLEALDLDVQFYIINRENVPWLTDLFGKKWPFDCVVVDESSSFKNPSSKRFKALKKVIPHTNYMVLLSGTPSPNGLHDLWSQCFLIDEGESLGKTLTAFRRKFFFADFFGHSYSPKEGAADAIHKIMKPYCLSMDAQDYLELPPKIVLQKEISLTPKLIREYNKFKKQMWMQFSSGDEIEAVNTAVLAGKLMQFASGAMYIDNGHYKVVHNEKIEALENIIEEAPNDNILVAYNFKSDLERLKEHFPSAVVLDKNPDTIERWNNGEIPLLLAHPASTGHGLNLQKGGNIIVWFSLTWSLELYQQFNARLYRQGQTKPLKIIHLIAKNTNDGRVVNVLENKDANQNDLLEALK